MEDEVVEEEKQQDDELLSSLLGRLSGSHPHIAVDVVRARNLLEASAGNIELAVALYWDDYMARREHQHHQHHHRRNPQPPQQQQQQQQPQLQAQPAQAAPQQQEASVSVSDDEMALLLSSSSTPTKKASSRKRKRISNTAGGRTSTEGGTAHGLKSTSASPKSNKHASLKKQAKKSAKPDEDDDDDDENDEEASKKPSAASSPPRLFAAMSSSHPVKTNSNEYDSSSSSSSSDDGDHDSDADYSFLEDEEEPNQKTVSNKIHADSSSDKSTKDASESKSESSNNNNNNNNNAVILKSPTWLLWGTPAQEEAADSTTPSIPQTWHRAGFTLSSCTTGLSLSPPPNSSLNNPNHNSTNSKRPPDCPHHCGAVTALTSIVTAMIYAGVSIQGNTVNCNSTRTPWAELNPTQRRQQYDQRLTHVLAAILHIAAKAALHRKRKALQAFEKRITRRKKKRQIKWKQEQQRKNQTNLNSKLKQQPSKDSHSHIEPNHHHQGYYYDDHLMTAATDDSELKKRQTLHRKLNLCPVCTWEEDSHGEPRFPGHRNNNDDDDNNANADPTDIRIRISYTNINDLKLFVQSNLRSFLGPGGCALFMENILHIHGINRVTKMVSNARKKSHAKSTHNNDTHQDSDQIQPLLACNCEQRQMNRWEKFMELKRKSPANLTSPNFDSTKPPGHDCLSIELLSILLTGNAHSFIEDMAISSLGIGFLDTNHQCNFSRHKNNAMKYPIKPIWIIRGESCYSTIWHNDFRVAKVIEERAKTLGNRSKTGSDSFRLEHWNCWYDLPQNKTTMRVITARNKDKSDKDTPEEVLFISQEDIDNVSIHKDDENYFPKQYCRWRFRFLNSASSDSSTNNHDVWIPYFRLDKHQRQIVDRKLAPKINLAIWSRWHGAKVDDFQPEPNLNPVV